MPSVPFSIDKSRKVKLYRQLYDGFTEAIRTGTLKANTKLLSVRDLAKELDVSRNTVTKAYSMLMDAKLIYSKNKSGFYVADCTKISVPQIPALQSVPTTVPTVEDILRQHLESELQSNQEKLPQEQESAKERIAPRPPKNKSSARFKNALLKTLQSDKSCFTRENPCNGILPLRKRLADFLGKSKALPVSPDQITISGNLKSLVLKVLSLLGNSYTQQKRDGIGLLQLAKELTEETRPTHPYEILCSEEVKAELEKVKTPNLQAIRFTCTGQAPGQNFSSAPLQQIYISAEKSLKEFGINIFFAAMPQALSSEYVQKFYEEPCSVSVFDQLAALHFLEN